MPKSTQVQVQECLTRARELLGAADPEVLSMTQVAERVADVVGVCLVTARRYLRKSVESGDLVELMPDRGWHVTWPEAVSAGLSVRLIKDHASDGGNRTVVRNVLSADHEKRTGTTWGPGNTTYLITRNQADHFVKTVVEEELKKKEAESARRNAAKEAEAAAIRRREPGLKREIRRMRMLLTPVWTDRDNMVSADVHLHESYSRVLDKGLERGQLPVEDHDLVISLSAWNDGASLVRQILAKGLEWYLSELPDMRCMHCGDRIFHLDDGDRGGWWHWGNSVSGCKGGETKATPAKADG